MIKKVFGLGFLMLWAVAACQQKATTMQQTLPIGDTSRNALDWDGTYSGMVPCADCEGILTVLELTKEETYTLKRTYVGKDPKAYLTEGRFAWNELGNIITLDGIEQGPNRYLVGENQLFQLDMEGNRITGALADNYVLRKGEQTVEDPLLGKKWVLKQVMGKDLPENEAIFIQFEPGSSRVLGFGGCNQFFGNYELKEGWRIQLSQIGRTQKLCQEMQEIEDRFFEALENADNYSLNDEGDVLSLNKARMAPLLRFEIGT
ncbi:MAG: copper resistance protein NlpE N-terminal domain-containing protein [Lunatimonas sp.]|uniref:copper resistance protein NlpE N-terminal domain-containing protein n=1 Tax=Lunatimonas sp. TaxID=2060141 RepID=UPI00263AC8A5|nr:copper resistance protein NlpE N-terminal domain-containing protein [Lunatimonas sp.]MCC5939820.1 copper resistance protein NlpE N-terminal domain-containing protein [Lunatimonas sp.]